MEILDLFKKQETKMNKYLEAQEEVVKNIIKQVVVQINKWGYQRHNFAEWDVILGEELAEFRCKVIAAKESGYDELIHTVAVGLAWLIDIRMVEK